MVLVHDAVLQWALLGSGMRDETRPRGDCADQREACSCCKEIVYAAACAASNVLLLLAAGAVGSESTEQLANGCRWPASANSLP